MEKEKVAVPKHEAYKMAAEDVEECVELLKRQVKKKELKEDWICSVAGAHLSNFHVYIDVEDDWTFNYLGGMDKDKVSREQFLDHIQSTLKKMQNGEIVEEVKPRCLCCGAGTHRKWKSNYICKDCYEKAKRDANDWGLPVRSVLEQMNRAYRESLKK